MKKKEKDSGLYNENRQDTVENIYICVKFDWNRRLNCDNQWELLWVGSCAYVQCKEAI